MSQVMQRFILFAVLFLGGNAAAQVATGGLAGTVTDEQGAPLAGVSIEVQFEDGGAQVPSAVTAEDGRFTIEGVPGGRELVLDLEAPDGRRRLVFGVHALASGRLDLGALVLPQPARLEGRVIAADGSGLPETEVSLWTVGVSLQRIDGQLAGLRHPALSMGRCKTDVDGRFALPVAAPGWATVAALAPGHAPDIRSILLSAGAVTRIDLQPGPGFRLRGRVVAPDAGQPISGRVSASRSRSSFPVQDGMQSESATLDADGSWELADLPAGLWFMRPSFPGYDGEPVTIELPKSVEGVVELPLVAVAPETGSIEALVTDEQGQPLDAFTLWCASFMGGKSVPGGLSIPWGDWVPFDFGPDAAGRARLGPLEVGEYQLIATTDGRVSDTSKVSVRLEPASVEAKLSVGPAESLRVEVVDERTGQPLPGVRLQVGLRLTFPLEDWVETDANGMAVIGRLPRVPVTLRVVGELRDTRDKREETRVTLPHPDPVRLVGKASCLLHVRLSPKWRAAGEPGQWFDRAFAVFVNDAEGSMAGFIPNVVEGAALTLPSGDYHVKVAAFNLAEPSAIEAQGQSGAFSFLRGVGAILAEVDVTLGEAPVTTVDF